MLPKKVLLLFQIFLIAFIFKGIHFLHESGHFSRNTIKSNSDIKKLSLEIMDRNPNIQQKIESNFYEETFDFNRDVLVHVHIQVGLKFYFNNSE